MSVMAVTPNLSTVLGRNKIIFDLGLHFIYGTIGSVRFIGYD